VALSWLSEVTNLRVWPICLGLLGCDLSGCATVCVGVAECVAVRENDVGRCVGACGCEVAASADRWRNATRAGPTECAYKQRPAKHQTGESFHCSCVFASDVGRCMYEGGVGVYVNVSMLAPMARNSLESDSESLQRMFVVATGEFDVVCA